ncbi:DNA-binding transcriptional regulator, MarR family [Aeromonas sp. RU39B]|jgi:DNA-binding MarR family transcriptional regulator|uniref:MarR family winged helix-turn-helix transcriptional regulator n=1 Tax=Aeromonas sp. RU39B TaxID=1907416 RepID=UPI000953ED9A|nr:MarR family winged helix-turn-helix transcriptional regulator [Aeromonas sp. RU39B]SIQ74812.1 DNA-binding transcriptional regulator, MarR family [Aeromonas sp. RU39B]
MHKPIGLLQYYPPYQLVHAAEMVRETFEQFYQQRYQLTVPQWRLMMVLGPHYPISQKDLVEASGMDKVRISREIHRLGEKGMVTTQSHAQDKRINLVSLSEVGQALFEKLKVDIASWETTLSQHLPNDSRIQINEQLKSLDEAIGKLHILDKD